MKKCLLLPILYPDRPLTLTLNKYVDLVRFCDFTVNLTIVRVHAGFYTGATFYSPLVIFKRTNSVWLPKTKKIKKLLGFLTSFLCVLTTC
jgi:Ni,Fe-hydrogenase I cytochrome b subunit